MLQWLRANLGTLLLAFVMALTVWVAAVNQDDPIVESIYPQPIEIVYADLTEGMLIVGHTPQDANVTIRAPDSVWKELSPQDIYLEADLSGLEAGIYRITLKHHVNREPSQVTEVEPEVVILTLEPSTSKELAIQVLTFDQPALGYVAEEPIAVPDHATVVGPTSVVEQIYELRAEISLANRRESLDQEAALIPLDENGNEVKGVLIPIEQVRITVQIKPGERYRPISVIPDIEGREELEAIGHYQVMAINVIPREVIVFSSDKVVLDALPGYVETVPLNILDETHEVERRLPLNLPEGVSLVGDQSVLVQVTIVPVMESITITRVVEIQGLGPDLYAYSSPDTVDVILTGPAATLDALRSEDVRVVLDLLDHDTGIYQIEPQVILLPTDLEFDTPMPATIEVNITTTPPPTPTPTS